MKRKLKFYIFILKCLLSVLNRCYLLILKMALSLRRLNNTLRHFIAVIERGDE